MKRLAGEDAVMLYGETPNVHTHTLKVALIDTSNDQRQLTFERFRRVVERRLPVLDPLRYRLVDIPFKLHHPMWLEDCEVDLDFHLRRVTVPSPGGRREFDDVVARIAETQLDRSRPLWEMHFAEGLVDRKLAVIVKVHHALADGVASANLLARALDPTVTAPDRGQPTLCASPSSTALLRAAGRDHLKQLKQLPPLIRETAVGVARVRRRSRERGEHADLARPFKAPKTFINHKLSPGRRFATATLSLAEVKETSKHVGISLNDLVLAISAGAVRELLLRHDGAADEPMIGIGAYCTDPSADRLSGNAVTMLPVSLPVHLNDRVQRVRLVGVATKIAKEENALRGPELIGRWLDYMPPPLAPPAFRWLARRDHNRLGNLVVSTVRGPSERGSIAGAPFSEFYSVGPLTQADGMNITAWSYVDQLNICVLTDDRTLEDAHEATDLVIREFAEIRRAAGLSPELVQVETAMPQASAARRH